MDTKTRRKLEVLSVNSGSQFPIRWPCIRFVLVLVRLQKIGNLDWDRSKWNNPTKMMSDFKQSGVKTILITEPYFTTQSSNYAVAEYLKLLC
jgi:alpha-glucosidase (family GH31 glycosyl hydrolase)